MRFTRLALVGIVVTTSVIIARHISERDNSDRSRSRSTSVRPGTDDPNASPTPDESHIPLPGESLTISLSTEPAAFYSLAATDSSADPYREVALEAAARRANYDNALSRAAREIAVQAALHRGVAPESVTTFLLHSSGAPDSSAARFSLRTNDDNDDVVGRAIADALAAPPGGPGRLYFGVGEADTPGDPHNRHIVVVMARRAYVLDQAPRQVAVGGTWRASGTLADDLSSATAKVLYPDGHLEDAELKLEDHRFELRVNAGSIPGQLSVGLDAVGDTGPGKIFQLTVEVGRQPPRALTVTIREPEPELKTIEEAEAHALRLLARDRAAADVPTLELDPELSSIARGHSEEMASSQFFGHLSPTTGLAGDRIEDAAYRTSSYAENLAKNDSLGEAELSLLESVGHRANLLGRDFSHVGVGVARSIERGRTQWYLTQLFARKTVDIDPDALAADLYGRVAAARRAANQLELATRGTLEAVAVSGAEEALGSDRGNDNRGNIAERLGRRARDASGRSVSVSVQLIYTAEQFLVPKNTADDNLEAIGIGVAQSQSDRAGRIAVVVITSQRRR